MVATGHRAVAGSGRLVPAAHGDRVVDLVEVAAAALEVLVEVEVLAVEAPVDHGRTSILSDEICGETCPH